MPYQRHDDNVVDDASSWSLAVIIIIILSIVLLIWWVYCMIAFKFKGNNVIIVLLAGIFATPAGGLIAAYVLKT